MLSSAISIIKESQLRAQQGHLGTLRQLGEMLILQLRYGLGPGFYHKARLWRREIPFQRKTRFRIGKQYASIVNTLNNRSYFKVSQHKVVEKALLTLFNIPNAEFFGLYHPKFGCCADGSALTDSGDFLRYCENKELHSMAVKMPEGYCGDGFDIIEIDVSKSKPVYSQKLQRDLSAEDYFELKLQQSDNHGLLLEAPIEQHPQMGALNESSVNTLRMWVRQNGGDVSVKSVLIKVGEPGSLIDYTPNGGFSVAIDVATGILGQPKPRLTSIDAKQDISSYTELPQGFEVPFFKEAIALAEKSLAVFPELNFAGMDIAISTDGPMIVELNVEPDSGHAISVDSPTLDLMGMP